MESHNRITLYRSAIILPSNSSSWEYRTLQSFLTLCINSSGCNIIFKRLFRISISYSICKTHIIRTRRLHIVNFHCKLSSTNSIIIHIEPITAARISVSFYCYFTRFIFNFFNILSSTIFSKVICIWSTHNPNMNIIAAFTFYLIVLTRVELRRCSLNSHSYIFSSK